MPRAPLDFSRRKALPLIPPQLLCFWSPSGSLCSALYCLKKFLSVIPILIAIIAGYIAAVCCGTVDFQAVIDTPFFSLPNFQLPKFDINAILIILPALLVITSEHIGHQLVTSKVVGRGSSQGPPACTVLIFADNFSSMLSGLVGSVPTTTYGENIGVMAVTRVYSVQVIGGAAVLSILCSFYR